MDDGYAPKEVRDGQDSLIHFCVILCHPKKPVSAGNAPSRSGRILGLGMYEPSGGHRADGGTILEDEVN